MPESQSTMSDATVWKLLLGVIVFAVAAVLFALLLSSCNRPVAMAPVPADADKAAIEGALITQPVRGVDVQGQTVVLTLSVTKARLAPGGGKVGAEDAGRSIAGLVFTDVPGLTWVRVIDANRELVGMYEPAQ